MPAAWPALPTAQYLNISVTPKDSRYTFEPDAGLPMSAPSSTELVLKISFDILLTGAEYTTFWTWYRSTLGNGTDSFTGLADVGTDVAAIYKFDAVPVMTMLRPGTATPTGTAFTRIWRGTLQLWQLP